MVEERRDNKKAAIDAGTRCVVLVDAAGAAPADLLSGLSQRGVSTVVVAEPAEAMVELNKQTSGILVVVDPESRPWLDDLVQAVRQYHPRTVRWGYRAQHPSGQAQLQPLADPSQTSAAQDKQTPVTDQDPDASLHFTLPNPRSPLGRVQSQVPRERMRSLVVKVQGPAEVGEPLISEEELAMLLGPVPEEPGGGDMQEQGGRP